MESTLSVVKRKRQAKGFCLQLLNFSWTVSISLCGLCFSILASGCSMEARMLRGRAYDICDATPMVEPWLSFRGEARRNARFTDVIALHSFGTVAVRPLETGEVEALLGKLPAGYGNGVLLLKVELTLAASSPSGVVVSSTASLRETDHWRGLRVDEVYALFGTSRPPNSTQDKPRRTLLGGGLFVLTLGIVDLENRWNGLTDRSSTSSAETRAARDAVTRLFMAGSQRQVEPGGTIILHELVALTDVGKGPLDLYITLEPAPRECRFIRGKVNLTVTVEPPQPNDLVFDARNLERPVYLN